MIIFAESKFIEGIRADSDGDKIKYSVKPGIFKELCEEALNNPNKPCVIMIDEINRGDISRIFGELITLIEDDKRCGTTGDSLGFSLKLPYSKSDFCVPNNVFIIGTMNDTDRSIALLDVALRRRFTFFNVPPNSMILEKWISGDQTLKDMVIKVFNTLNERISGIKGEDSQIGHAFFKDLNDSPDPKRELLNIFKYKIIPLLKEIFHAQDDILFKSIFKENFLMKSQNGSSVYKFKEDVLNPNDTNAFMAEFKKLSD